LASLINSKKAIAAEVVNIIIGVLFVVIAFFIFLGLNAQLKSLTSQDVFDAHYIDIYSSYSGFLLKLNSKTFDKFYEDISKNSDVDEYVFNSNSIQIYDTFDGQTTTAGKKNHKTTTTYYYSTTGCSLQNMNTVYFEKYVGGNFLIYSDSNLCKSGFYELNKCNFRGDFNE